jgi:hypothetical protein
MGCIYMIEAPSGNLQRAKECLQRIKAMETVQRLDDSGSSTCVKKYKARLKV